MTYSLLTWRCIQVFLSIIPVVVYALMINQEFAVDPTLASVVTQLSSVAQILRSRATVHNVTAVDFDAEGGPSALMYLHPMLACQIIKPFFMCSDSTARVCLWGHLPYPTAASFVNVRDTPRLAGRALTKYCAFDRYKMVLK